MKEQPKNSPKPEDKITRRICAGLVVSEIARAKRDAILGVVGFGATALLAGISPLLAAVIGLGGAGYFFWRFRKLDQNQGYLVKKYDLTR